MAITQYVDGRIESLQGRVTETQTEIEELQEIKRLLQGTAPEPPEEPEDPPTPEPLPEPPDPTDTEYGYRGFTTREPKDNEVIISALPFEITEPGDYILMDDLSCDASGIGIKTGNFNLNLNGHTITYGEGNVSVQRGWTYRGPVTGNVAHNGITCPSRPDFCKDFKFEWNPINRKKFPNGSIFNGRIRSGKGEGLSYSPALNVAGLLGANVFDLILEVACPDSESIYTPVDGEVAYCTIVNSGQHITNRHQLPSSVKCSGMGLLALDKGIHVHHCHLDGFPQVGILGNKRVRIDHNLIQASAVATNCYSIMGRSVDGEACDNRIVAYNGRGIGGGENWKYLRNYVEVRESADRNPEYGSLQTHGIKVENNFGCLYEHNTVVAIGSPSGQPTALSISSQADKRNVVRNNTFRALQNGEDEISAAVCFVTGDASSLEIENCVFESDDWLVRQLYATDNIVFKNCTFRALEGCQGFFHGSAYNKGRSGVWRFVDCTFDGVDPRTAKWPPSTVQWDADITYYIEDSSKTLKVHWDSIKGKETITQGA